MEVGITIKDQYQVVEHIGRGGMADVWSARDQRLNRLVAIKTISQSLSTDVDPIALFQQEAQTIAQMEHPHILPIYDFGDYKSNLYIVMRYVTGGSLEDKLEEKPLNLQETLAIAGNIAKALDYAHANNIIHLDLKPPNILMDSGGSPYLADFGLATVLDKQGRAQNPGSGTLLYMAPEQLTAEVIDHRADIYSFCVMIFHMLTGTLPFDGTVPLAIKQLQFQERLPDLDNFDPDIPYQITDILRQGTDTEPSQRQSTLSQIVDQMRNTLQLTTIDLDSAWGAEDNFESAYGMDSALTVNIDDAGLLEAADIYVRAKHVWSGGNGRFLLGVSHFMMMCDYYMEAEENDLEIDDLGRQMLLRGALEYDYHVDYWWSQVNDDTRRWVCLHAIRSENAPARIRALYRLETLPDDVQKPVIPNLVANALAIETNKEAKLAAIQVLGTRAKLLKPSQSFDIKTEFRGRLLSTTTRLGIEILPEKVWRDAVYSPEIDLLLAKEALDVTDDDVSEAAARVVGRIHSLTSLRFIADAQRQNVPNSLRALALIRDEAPYLPDVVNRQARLYAWIANTIRRITDNPMELVFRFMFALLGGAIAFGQHVYITYRSQALFVPQRWGNTLAVGLMMGLFIAILVMFADVIVTRVKGFWPNWLRLILSATMGLLFGTLVWTGFTWLYLNQQPLWDLMRMGGLGLAFGLVASTMFNLKSWQSLILTSTAIFITIFVAYFNFCTQLYYCVADANFTPIEGITSFSMAPIALAGFLFGTMFGWFVPRIKTVTDAPPTPFYGLTQYGGLSILLLLGLVGSVITYDQIISQTSVNWDYIVLLFVMPMILSAIGMVILERVPRILYLVLGLVGFVAVMLQVQNTLTGIETLIAPQFGADYIDPLFAYDIFWQAFTVALPVSVTIAFGAFSMEMFHDLRAKIGYPAEEYERNAWLTGILLYIMVISGFITILSPFSLHQDILWAIGWSIVGALTFTTALATWQWKRWGANGLILCALIIIVGAFLADARSMLTMISNGDYPIMFNLQSTAFWGVWAVATGVMTIGTMRHKLWSAFGLVVMIFLWFVISIFINDIGDSLAGLAIIHVPLLAFAMRFDWQNFEDRKQKAKQKPVTSAIPASGDGPTTTKMPAVATANLETEVGSPQLDKVAEFEPIPPEEIRTELAVGHTFSNETELATQLAPDVDDFSLDSDVTPDSDMQNVYNLQTEIDPNPNANIPNLQTQASLNKQTDDEKKPKFKLNTGTLSDPEETKKPESKPKLKIDTSLLDSKPDSKPATKPSRQGLKIDTGLLGSKSEDKPDSKPPQKGLKIDTGLLGSKSEDKPDSKPPQKGLKIDTSLLGSKSEDKPSSKPPQKGLKIDTGLLGSKSEDKPDSKPPQKGLKIDTSLLGSKSDSKPGSKPSQKGLKIDTSLLGSKSDSKPGSKPPQKGLKIDTDRLKDKEQPEEEQFFDPDETLPSRNTTKMSTSEIKKEIQEEALRLKEEADRKKSESKPKFTLNTSRIKSEPDQEDDTSSEDEE